MGEIDLATVNWARAQFTLTAMYHWLFVPITLGLSFLCAFYETIYVRTGDQAWKRLTKFWMTLFGINFAIGVATGIIMEFEFGTNWSNYSWMVGDIFGAPLAIEGIFAFFLEATFFAVMFFGWERTSKGFHLFSTWMVAIGSNLSALWILVANGWMQYPVGMAFNPDNARFEMQNIWEVVLSPVAVAKFTHTTTSSFVVGSCFVITISCYYLLKRRHVDMAKKSIAVAAVFGLLSSFATAVTGDESAYANGHFQPMKMAAYEGLYQGAKGADIVAFGILNGDKEVGDDKDPFTFELSIPKGLSLLAKRDLNAFVPGINDLVYGNEAENIESIGDKITKGKAAITDLKLYKEASANGDEAAKSAALARFNENQAYMGFGHLNSPEEAVPPVASTYYSFHYMVYVGSAVILLFLLFLRATLKDTLADQKWLLGLGVLSFFAVYLASEFGWVVAEVGRQPWAIQDMLPVKMASTNIAATSVATTFFIFLVLFTILAIAELKIMLKQINIGPEDE
ncbi:cytochrome ubiquinol oxidase subunit I [Desulforhopalus singaporensis]|uniref:Cytochrome bd-I ubiquinol oxidase subunit 1 apoprotein n=1 Tax=Desulforhopalus singaporensis TaxID=91360 RepID=A0A1H0QXE5_9BACT|nr:cytochrome ubiquinol oxidase subunit I [Desulforhopalus singaporensis]SDP21549.1 cytochrome bd-I ubiquinol oxidase subunit 1 apoprotein [Desulforhopalus singaporensis]